VTNVSLEAVATGPTDVEVPFWDQVDFYYRVPGSPESTFIGTASYDGDADNGVERFFYYSFTLVGDDSLPIGPIEVFAIATAGASIYPTAFNTSITVAAGSVGGN
jgi:hypothetical protein